MSDGAPQELRTLVSFEKGKPPAQQPYFGQDAELYLTPEYLRGGPQTEPIKAGHNAVRIADGDTIVLWDGSNAGEVLRGRNGVLASTMTRLQPAASLDRSYFYYAVKGLEPGLRAQTAGSGIPHVDKEVLGKRLIRVFGKSEQRKVAEVLAVTDSLIEQTESLIAKQQRIKAGLMQDLLTRGIDENGVVRSEKTHKFKESPLGRIPLEWIASTVTAFLKEGPKNGYSPNESDEWCGAYVLGLGCLSTAGFQPTQLKFAPRLDARMEAAILQPGDFLISRSNTRSLVGLVGIYREVGYRCIYPDLMVRLRFKDDVSPQFMEYVFASPSVRRQIENAATGTSGSMVKINAAIIKNLNLVVPPSGEQKRILEVLESEHHTIAQFVDHVAKLRRIKTGLMQDLLTGKKRVTPLLEQTQEVAHGAV